MFKNEHFNNKIDIDIKIHTPIYKTAEENTLSETGQFYNFQFIR